MPHKCPVCSDPLALKVMANGNLMLQCKKDGVQLFIRTKAAVAQFKAAHAALFGAGAVPASRAPEPAAGKEGAMSASGGKSAAPPPAAGGEAKPQPASSRAERRAAWAAEAAERDKAGLNTRAGRRAKWEAEQAAKQKAAGQ